MYYRLELVNDTNRSLVVGGYASCASVGIIIQLVELVRRVHVHVFVEVVPGTQFYVFNQVRIAAAEATASLQVFTFSLT